MAGKTFRRSAEVAPVFFQVELDDGKLLRFDCRRSVPGGVALAFADAGGLDEDASESQRGSAARALACRGKRRVANCQNCGVGFLPSAACPC